MRTSTSRSFIAVDVETASPQPGSICELGLARFLDGRLIDQRSWRIRPRATPVPGHVRVHGIGAADLARCLPWRQVYPDVLRELGGQHLVSHTFFDRREIFRACCDARCTMFSYRSWTDSCREARRAWPHLQSHTLGALAARFNLAYRAHAAVEDARVAGEIFLRAAQSQAAAHVDE